MSQVNIAVEEFIQMNSEVIGFGPESQCAYDLINKARIIAYASGDWVGTLSYERVKVDGCNFMLPSKFETIKRAKGINGIDVTVDGLMDLAGFNGCCEDVIVRINKKVYLPFQLTEKLPLSFFAVNKKDEGKELRVPYMDTAGSLNDEIVPLLHQKPTRLINIPLDVLRISKPTTVGMVGIQHGDKTAYIPANEKSPTYNVYSSSLSDCVIAVEVKHKYIPYTIEDANSVLDINPEALSSLIVAVKAKDKKKDDNWIAQYAASVKLATDFLKAELKNETTVSFAFIPVNTDDKFFNSLEQP